MSYYFKSGDLPFILDKDLDPERPLVSAGFVLKDIEIELRSLFPGTPDVITDEWIEQRFTDCYRISGEETYYREFVLGLYRDKVGAKIRRRSVLPMGLVSRMDH